MKKALLIAIIFSLIGMAFSGFLTFERYFSGTCALTEGCSLFLGYPSCIYGFALFLLAFVLALVAIRNNRALDFVMIISLLGILFSLYSSVKELTTHLTGYTLFLPSCVYGLAIYSVVFICSILARK